MSDTVSTAAPAARQGYDRVLTGGRDASRPGEALCRLLSEPPDVAGLAASRDDVVRTLHVHDGVRDHRAEGRR